MDKDFVCALCLEFETDYPDVDYFVSTECGHVYHYRCISDCYENGHKGCPVDRKEIDITKLRRLYGSEIRGNQNLKAPGSTQATSAGLLANMANVVEYDFKFKIILVGDSAVGKSCLMQRYTDDLFDPYVNATVGCDWRSKTINIGRRIISLSIWDTVGQEKYRSLISNYVREAHGCFLVYDITRADSIEHIEDWLSYVKNFALHDTVAILIGNKADLEKSRVISKDVGKKLGVKLQVPFFETSARDSYNVDAAFRCLAASILDNRDLIRSIELKQQNPNIQLGDQPRGNNVERRQVCSQSWQFTKSRFSGAARSIKSKWDQITKNRPPSSNEHS